MFELGWISLHRVKRRSRKFHFDVFVDDFVEQAVESIRDSVQIHSSGLEYLAPRECKQLAREGRRSIRLFANALKTLRHLRIVAAVFESDFRPSQDCTNYIGEIVRDTTGELPDGFEFLRLPQLPLERAQFGHVFGDHLECVGLLIRRQPPQVEAHGKNSAVSAFPFRFRTVNLAEFPAGCHQPRILLGKTK